MNGARIVSSLVLLLLFSVVQAKGKGDGSKTPKRPLNQEVGMPQEKAAPLKDASSKSANSKGDKNTADNLDPAPPQNQGEAALAQEAGKGNAKTIDFSADEVMASLAGGREKTVLRGNVRVRVNDQRMVADDLQIYGENYTILTGTGKVRIRDDVKKIYIEGSDFSYDRINKILRIRGEISIEDQEKEVIVRAAYLEYHEQTEVLNLQINVRVFNKDITTKSEVATYRRQSQTLELTGSPVVNKGTDRYESTLITVDLNTREVVLEGGATGVIETE